MCIVIYFIIYLFILYLLLLLLLRLDKKEVEKKKMIRLAVENKVTLLLIFMASDYDDISAAVFEFARDYIQVDVCVRLCVGTCTPLYTGVCVYVSV